jgi:subtilase family serine protease
VQFRPAYRHDRQRRRASAGLARAWTISASSIALAAACLALAGAASVQPAARSRPASHLRDYRRACPVAARPGRMACLVLVRTNVRQQAERLLVPGAAPMGVGYGPASLQNAYRLPSSTAGAGQTVAVVDAMDDPNAAADLATYRSDWGLPPCGAGCFSKVNQNGAASPLPAASGLSGWATEESLDIDMVSAICPLCHIILVESNSASIANLGTAVNSAISRGADFVSNSYGGPESASDPSFDTMFFKHAGVAITASAGDSGFGVEYPAASQYVTAVGGTSLRTSASARGWSETVWGSSGGGEGTGSGCSADDAKPAWQNDTGCARRTNNDVSAVADPNTGVAVYDTYDQGGWLEVGGTSASSPIIASTFALAGHPAAATFPSSYIYRHASSLFDVTSGADGSCAPAYLCHGGAGYDGPTGWGTPNGVTAFTSGATSCAAAQLIGNPGFETGRLTPWTSTAGVLASTSLGVPAHTGSWLAWLDGYGAPHTDTLSQTLTLPPACVHASLSFWLNIQTNDPATKASDTFTIQVLSPSGTVLATLGTLSNLTATGRYARHTFSLAPYIGQKITVRFTGKQTLTGHSTSFLQDDTALTVS